MLYNIFTINKNIIYVSYNKNVLIVFQNIINIVLLIY